jgi:sterol desaturase/sphingolipid hydroxylase (fatty acid hydroxylase superfamily)
MPSARANLSDLPFFQALPGFWKTVAFIATNDLTNYLIFAGMAWLLGHVLCKSWWWSRKIIQTMPTAADMRREASWSLLTVVVYGFVGATTLWLGHFGWLKLYYKINDHSWAWFWGSIVVVIFIHDTYFYWTHRLMHHPKLFRFFHRTHHESHNPSPWAAYCFSIPEAIVQAGIFPLVALTIPIHPAAFGLFMFWQITFNVAGHTGYEFHARWLMDSWLGKFLNTPTNHIQHHDSFRGNFGLYFNFWDRWMGTNHPDYEKRFREVTSRTS